ncbi:hypothetical protein TSOC_013676, partial [Tetrabaena socialis]
IICEDGVRYGRVVGQHVMRWAHTTLVLSFATLGFVELAALRVRFPQGTTIASLVVAHIVCCIIFSYHQKASRGGAEAGAGPGLGGRAAALAKLYFHMLAAFWLGIVGYIIYGNSVFWSPTFDGHPDVSPAMFAPILFTLLMMGMIFLMLAIYAGLDVLAARRLRAGGLGGLGGGGAPVVAAVALTQLPGGRRAAAGEEGQGLLAGGEGSAAGGSGGRFSPGRPLEGDGFDEYGAEREGGMRARV